ncbi:LamG-like jellyroll fold domain-containing protein [Pelagicoccus mobilis]|uniref:Carbohydrate binding domain-containing protein n=1 Tax=Pelagicoccus mobilis TaxID=415221 RepID=A0A934VQ43_9BACT|nr:LamG-like jellyroll fold domain-containing protein [Pelagicoccus mobilis]MBK1877957.1 carbohydrate binding domain-containing protein [Pelagicoccus mobilis]
MLRQCWTSILALGAAAVSFTASVSGQFHWQSLPNFSHAGYKGGGVPLPNDVPTVLTVNPEVGDDTERIQNAIDQVSAMPIQANGYRGAVLLTAGTYEVTTELRIASDGVVLRGEGQDVSVIDFDGSDPFGYALLIGGGSYDDWKTQVPDTIQPITTSFIPIGSYSFAIEDASDYSVGDEIVIWHEAKSAWFESVDQGGVINETPWEFQDNWEDVRYRRIITNIDGHVLTVDAPVFMDLDWSLASLWVYKYDRPAINENIGIEDFTINIVTESESDETQARIAVHWRGADDCWARRVTTRHFWDAGFRFSGAVHCTVEDCSAVEPHSLVGGARRYNFHSNSAQLILFKNCYANNARHAFVTNGHANDSGIVFLDCEAENNITSSECHQRWTTGVLFDSIAFTGEAITPTQNGTVLLLGNRGDAGNAQGWAAANCVAWRCDATANGNRIVLQDPPGSAQNYAIGCLGSISGSYNFPGTIGLVKLVSDVVTWPRSLYEAQIAERAAASSDTTAPAVPGNLDGGNTPDGTITLSWDAISGESDVVFYRIYRDGIAINTTLNTTYVDGDLVPETTYIYSIAAVDHAGNVSGLSGGKTLTTPADYTAPETPQRPTATPSSAFSVDLTWPLSGDDFGLAFYRVYRNGVQIGSTGGTSFSDSGLSAGVTYFYAVRAVDLAGNPSAMSPMILVTTPSAGYDPFLWLGMPFEQETGDSVLDVTDNNNDGLLVGNAMRVANGRFGRALEFNGVSGHVDLGNLDIPSTAMSIAAWIRPDDFGISDARIISKATGTAEDDHIWMLSTISSGGTKLRFRLKTFGSFATSTLVGSTSIPVGGWTHVAATYDGATMRIYINGVLDGSMPRVGNVFEDTTVSATIGNHPFGGKAFDGLIDDVRIYRRALSGADVLAALNESVNSTGTTDSENPSVPSSLTAIRLSETQAQLSWSAATDNVGVLGYIVTRDGVEIGSTAGTSFVDHGLEPFSIHEYSIVAFDSSGNQSLGSNLAVIDTSSSNQPPTTPQNLVVAGVSQTEIGLSWDPSVDDGAVTGYRIFRDSLLIGTAATTSYTDSGLAGNSSYQYQVQAVDDDVLFSTLSAAVTGMTFAPPPNALQEPGFETSTMLPWRFYTSGSGNASLTSPGYSGNNAAKLTINTTASNIQFYQNDVPLEPNTEYRLTFAAYSSSGRDLRVSLQKNKSPYTNYGLNRARAYLTQEWQTFTIDFTTKNFYSPVEDGRFYFWLGSDAKGGDRYFIDDVVLSPLTASNGAIDVNVSGLGSVAKSPDQLAYQAGQQVTLTATPNSGWVFDRWSGDLDSTDNPLSVTVAGDLSATAVFTPVDGSAVFDIWYGDSQKFGIRGIPQAQINILGSVVIPDQIESLSYALNGVPKGALSMGPDENIRLARPGDFNVEIPFPDLQDGLNVVTVTATGIGGAQYSKDISVNVLINNVWPLPYTVNWSQASTIDDVAQVVDGKWELVPSGVKVVESHYDRLIAIGDIDWTDYEVTVPITVHGYDPQDAPLEPLVGIMLRWDGHGQVGTEQPGTEWRPIGAMGVHGWYEEGARGGHHFQIFETGTDKFPGYPGMTLPLETTYIFKMRVETTSADGPGLYHYKVWPLGQAEPSEWGITRQAEEGLSKGSMMLVAHYVEATFGNVIVNKLSEDTDAPTAPHNLQGSILSGGEVYLSWPESTDNTGIAYYQIVRNAIPFAQSSTTNFTDDTVIPGNSFRYRVLAVDLDGNFSDSSNEVVYGFGSPPIVDTDLWLGLGFEETGGALAYDRSENGNDGVLSSGVLRSTAGKFGRGIELGVGSGQVDLGTMDIPSTAFTMSAWIKPDSFNVLDARILSKASSDSEEDHLWMLSTFLGSGGVKARVRIKTDIIGTQTLVGNTNLIAGEWTHLAASYDGNWIRLYVNGAFDSAIAMSGDLVQDVSVPAAIGNQPHGGKGFDGLIDDVQIHLRRLSDAEIVALQSASVTPVNPNDTEPPTSPGSLTASLISDTRAQLSWDASTDNIGVIGYSILRDGIQLSNTVGNSFTNSNLTPGADHDFTVVAFDFAGNKSLPSNVANVEVPTDNQPPSVPQNLQATGASQTEINLTWDPSTDDGSVSEYRIFRDTVQVGTSSNASYTDSGLVADSSYDYQVQAVDDTSIVSGLSGVARGTTLPEPEPAPGPGPNVLQNPGFESGSLPTWRFYTSGSGGASVVSPGYTGSNAVKLTINSNASNIQLYQNDVPLEPNTDYRLTFAAYSTSGRDFRVSLTKHSSPYSNYGINRVRSYLTMDWQVFTIEFTTKNFSSPVSDGRLYFWLGDDARAGDRYYIDDIVLAPVDSAVAPDSQAPSVPAGLSATLLSDSQVQLNWSGSTDNVGVVGYNIYRDGGLIGNTSTTSFVDSGPVPGNSHNYTVAAYDLAGNQSAPSSGETVVIPAPSQPPSIPQNLAALGTSQTEISVTWDASTDDGSVVEYRVYRDSALIGTSSSTSYNDSGLTADTSYQYQVLAVDDESNASGLSDAETGTTLPAPSGDPEPNALQNPDFESGAVTPWRFYTSGSGGASVVSPGFSSANAVQVAVNNAASNIQLFQNDLPLQPNTNYRLTFNAYSNSGRDFRVSLQKDSSPYTNYGLNRVRAYLTSGWQSFTIEFNTRNFSSPVTDGRLSFWFANDARAGDRYFIDDVVLTEL